MAADGGLLIEGPGLSLCPPLAAHSSAEPSKPGRPLKEQDETGEIKQGYRNDERSNTMPALEFAIFPTSIKIGENFSISFV